MSDSGTDEEKERDVDSYGVMLLVVMSASAACQVGMVRQSVLDRIATAPSPLFPPLVPSSSIPSSRLSPPLLRSFLSSSSLPSPSPALLVSLYTVFIIAVRGLWLKICPLRQNPHFHEEVPRVVGVDNRLRTTFPAFLQGRRLKGLINFGRSLWFAMERVVAVQWRAGHTASVRHSESLADRSTFPQDWSALA